MGFSFNGISTKVEIEGNLKSLPLGNYILGSVELKSSGISKEIIWADWEEVTKINLINFSSINNLIRITFKIAAGFSTTNQAQIFVNDLPKGTLRQETNNTLSVYTEDIEVKTGDKISIMAKRVSGSGGGNIQEIHILGSNEEKINGLVGEWD